MTNWVPVFDQSSDVWPPVWDAILSIAEGIKSLPVEQQEQPQQLYEESLLFAYLAVAQNDSVWAERAIQSLNVAIERVGLLPLYGLYRGLCGLGWAVEHVTALLGKWSSGVDEDAALAEADDDPIEQIDTAVLARLECESWNEEYDLISGLVGFGIYFLERWPLETAFKGIAAVVQHLEKLAEWTDAGVSWYTGPDLLPDWQRKLYPQGYYNLGVAHGIPGIIHFLSETSAAGIERERANHMLESAIRWLLAQPSPDDSPARFGSWISQGECSGSRPVWCYGDLGICLVVLQAAIRVNREDWRIEAMSLLERCLAWPAEAHGISDTPLCHGAAGVAHILSRIYQVQPEERVLNAARQWFRRTLAMRQDPAKGVGGFLAWRRWDLSSSGTWEANPVFLDGALGVALALLSAVTPVEPAWDRLLLLSGRTFTSASTVTSDGLRLPER